MRDPQILSKSQASTGVSSVSAREPEVNAYLRFLDESIIELTNLNCELESRLSPALREEDGAIHDAEAKRPGVATPLARRLYDANCVVRSEIQRVRNILSCLEI